MRATEKLRFQMLRRVQGYLDTNGPSLTGGTSTTGSTSPTDSGNTSAPYQRQRAMLDDVVEQLTARAVEQDSAAMVRQGVTARMAKLRATLRDQHMRPIAEIAQALLPDEPDISPLRLSGRKLDAQGLVNTARGMAEAAAAHSAVFVEHGRPAEFLQALTAAAEDLRKALDERGNIRSARIGSTKAVAAEVVRGRKAVRLLNAVIRPVILENPKLLGEWNSACRIGRPRRGGAKAPATAAPSTTPTPAMLPAATATNAPGEGGVTPVQS